MDQNVLETLIAFGFEANVARKALRATVGFFGVFASLLLSYWLTFMLANAKQLMYNFRMEMLKELRNGFLITLKTQLLWSWTILRSPMHL